MIYKLARLIRYILGKDSSGLGQRQAKPDLADIRADHLGRYEFAKRYIKAGARVLDCACGTGYGSFLLARDTDLVSITAVEKDKAAVKFAQRHYCASRIRYLLGDVFFLDIENSCFDCIVSFETLEHVDGDALIKLFYQKLKPGGVLVVSSPNQDREPFNKRKFPFHLRHYRPDEFENLLSSNGFEIIGRYTQFERENITVSEGWEGLFNIAVVKKR
ncbi:MAG: class I SAM-dependent methyltransferase [Candidatus Omnitrophota bacterium]